MKHLSYEEFKKIIFESLEEAGTPPKPLGGAPKPLGSAPKPLGGAPKPLGGAPKPLGSAPKPIGGAPAQSTQQGAPLIPQNGGDDDSFTFSGEATKSGFRPGVYSCKYENFYETIVPSEQDQQVLKISVDYIHNITAQRWIDLLNKQFPDIIYAAKTEKPWLRKKVLSSAEKKENNNFKYLIKLIIKPGKNDEFIANADTIIQTLYAMPPVRNRMAGNSGLVVAYDPSFKDEFVKRLTDMVKKIPTESEIEEANIKIADNWTELLSAMKDPSVMNKLRSISGMVATSLNSATPSSDVRGDNGFDAGHQLSFKNKLQIFAQDPNATFVTQEFQWEKWNHEVIDRSKFIIVTIPSKKRATIADKDKGARDAGFAGGNDEYKMRKRRGELQGGEIHAVNMKTQYASSDDVFFYSVKMYDVANTRVMAGKESLFLDGPWQQRNLSNNLLGIPNTAARTIGAQSSTPAQVQQVSSPSTTLSNDQVNEIKDSIVAIVKSKVQSSNLPQETGNAERDIVNYAYRYSEYLLDTVFSGIAKKETKDALSQGFTAAVAIAVGIQDNTAADYLSRALANRGKDSTLRQLIVQWFDEYTDLLEAVYRDVVKKLKRNKASAAKKVVEEDGIDGTENAPEIRPVSFGKFEELCGVDDNGGASYEEQDNDMDAQMVKESFFNFLDKMDGHGRF